MAVATILLEKIPEIDYNEDLVNTASKIGDMDVIQMIISQMKFLDNIIDRKVELYFDEVIMFPSL